MAFAPGGEGFIPGGDSCQPLAAFRQVHYAPCGDGCIPGGDHANAIAAFRHSICASRRRIYSRRWPCQPLTAFRHGMCARRRWINSWRWACQPMAVFIIFPKLETRKRVKTKERRFWPPNQNSFAFIICKNHPESRLESLIYARSVMINTPYVLHGINPSLPGGSCFILAWCNTWCMPGVPSIVWTLLITAFRHAMCARRTPIYSWQWPCQPWFCMV